jgi:hypothetical protein
VVRIIFEIPLIDRRFLCPGFGKYLSAVDRENDGNNGPDSDRYNDIAIDTQWCIILLMGEDGMPILVPRPS